MKQRNKRGTVGIETKQGKLRLRLPRTICNVNCRYISTGLDDTPDNRRKVQVTAWQIEEDIQNGKLDPTLSRYKFNQPSVIITRIKDEPDLQQLWAAYCEYRQPLVAYTTYKQKYLTHYANHIQRLPSHKLTDSKNIRHYLVTTYSQDIAKRVLIQLNACCKWALAEGLIDNNPFVGMANELSYKWSSDAIDPFTFSERDAILNAYREHHTYSHYYNFICFLFYTGCRPGEACALKWRYISDKYILFAETWNARYQLTKQTKTGKSRRFPINEQLRALLDSVKLTSSYSPDSYLFTTHYHHKPISNERITYLLGWREIVNGLVDVGLVARYRPVYNTRSTFISLTLEAGLTVSQVASLVGNTPQVLLRHYASSQVKDVPVF
ncbi:site-specific integrase [Nostoc sp. CENA543]|uniref:tyrosine-type recombinase/integrase n=1 Tax=Nostoc sp. CENA543 TaxID=1869241 RepID=UPI000CA37156|nr:tyrosine-type recombinase/integrase [Nostoc sp. CENA543]AUT00352.1 site-specific integrase [Nostoc sp. CENA543]